MLDVSIGNVSIRPLQSASTISGFHLLMDYIMKNQHVCDQHMTPHKLAPTSGVTFSCIWNGLTVPLITFLGMKRSSSAHIITQILGTFLNKQTKFTKLLVLQIVAKPTPNTWKRISIYMVSSFLLLEYLTKKCNSKMSVTGYIDRLKWKWVKQNFVVSSVHYIQPFCLNLSADISEYAPIG